MGALNEPLLHPDPSGSGGPGTDRWQLGDPRVVWIHVGNLWLRVDGPDAGLDVSIWKRPSDDPRDLITSTFARWSEGLDGTEAEPDRDGEELNLKEVKRRR